MNFQKPLNKISTNDYDEIISLGNKCPTAMILRELGIYKQSYPFDYVPTTPKLILQYLQDPTEFFPEKNVVRTKDGVWFGHFNIDTKYDETIQKLKIRFDRLFTALKGKKRILFVYTSEADVYNEMGNRYNDNYSDLVKIRDYIEITYNTTNFTILAVHTNKSYEDTPNLINVTLCVHEKYLSDSMESHVPVVYELYRHILRHVLEQILT